MSTRRALVGCYAESRGSDGDAHSRTSLLVRDSRAVPRAPAALPSAPWKGAPPKSKSCGPAPAAFGGRRRPTALHLGTGPVPGLVLDPHPLPLAAGHRAAKGENLHPCRKLASGKKRPLPRLHRAMPLPSGRMHWGNRSAYDEPASM